MATIEEKKAELRRRQKIAKLKALRNESLPQPEPIREPTPSQDRAIALPADMTEADIAAARQQKIVAARPDPGIVTFPEPIERIATAIGDVGRRLGGDVFETEETKNLPRLGQLNVSLGKDLKRAAALVLASSEQERIQMIGEIVPGTTFRKDKLGNVIAKFPDGREGVLNKPGFSTTDALKFSSETAKYTPAGRTATGLGVGLKAGAKGRAALQTIGAATTATAGELAGEPLGGEFELSEIAIEGALAGGGELIGPAVAAARNASRAKRAGASVEEMGGLQGTIEQAREASKQTGIPLFQAQQTAIPAQLERQSFVSQLPAGTRASIDGLTKQNEAAANAVLDFLNQVAPPEALGTGAKRVRTAAEKAIALAKERRKQFAKFGEVVSQANAANAGKGVDLKKIRNIVRGTLSEAPSGGDLERTFKKINGFLRLKPKTSFKSFSELQRIKKEFDNILDKVGEGQVSPDIKVQVRDVRDALLEEMDSAFDPFKQARARFAAASPEVAALEDGLVGSIAKLDDTQLKGVANTLFNPETTNVQLVNDARKAIREVDPNAWNEITRVELENRIGKMRPGVMDGAAETVENIPGQLYRAIFGNQKQTVSLKQALQPEQAKNLAYLEIALKRAGLGRVSGSQTASREEIKRELRGGILSAIGSWFTPVKTTSEALREATFDKRTRVMTEALFDPQWSPRMSEIRKLDIRTPESARLFTQLLDDIDQSIKESQPAGDK